MRPRRLLLSCSTAGAQEAAQSAGSRAAGRARKARGVALVVALGLLLCVGLWAGSSLLDPVTRSSDCPRVASAFVDALRDGDERLVRSLTSSDHDIAEWFATRRGYGCPFSLDLDASVGSVVCGGPDANGRWSCGYHYLCSLGEVYAFDVDNIELEQQETRCKVTAWSKPCETFGWAEIGSHQCD